MLTAVVLLLEHWSNETEFKKQFCCSGHDINQDNGHSSCGLRLSASELIELTVQQDLSLILSVTQCQSLGTLLFKPVSDWLFMSASNTSPVTGL